ncbi:hypothetical protein B0T21DRAFT_431570 [Apiosordaria backusii]|uniref:Uncharacterized protein n=1 Tax=Apiosordaria backusii TaxID=314023 RepID=A0AA39ZSX0_9PEZI|nr:hypothetical protein B0T21DRAFT_431570 [Apiosordaria backusii]
MKEEEREKERVRQEEKAEEEEKGRLKGGRMVQRGGGKVWRKEPRFRGSGRVVVLDDPVRDGWEIALGEQVLGSDFWRENGRWEVQVEEEKECGDDDSMEDIVRDEPGYTIRTVTQRTRKKATKSAVRKRVSFKTPLVEEIPYLQPPELLEPDTANDCGLSVGSDSGCEYDDTWLDFSEDEAQGWVRKDTVCLRSHLARQDWPSGFLSCLILVLSLYSGKLLYLALW